MPAPSKQVETRVTVDASPERVYAVLTDFADYPSWCPKLSLRLRDPGEIRAGSRVLLRVRPSPLPIPCRIEVADAGRELRWAGGVPGLMHGSHYFELHPVPGEPDKTEVVHAERFSGLLVPLMWPLMAGLLHRLYADVNAGLAAKLGPA